MNESQPIWERGLRISDEDIGAQLRRVVEPEIHQALALRGFSETATMSSRIPLNSSSIIASRAYVSALESHLFDALSLSTVTHVFDRERILSRSDITLFKIGGLVTGRLVSHDDMFFAGVSKTNDARNPDNTVMTHPVDQLAFQDIVEDIRAHTPLGYSKSDSAPPFDQTLKEISTLSPKLLIDRNLILSEITHPDHGEIEFRLGETAVNKKNRGSNKRYNRLMGRVFEVSAKQPLGQGSLETKISYISKRGRPQMKLSVTINGTEYTEEEKQALYDEEIRRFQDVRYSRFSDAVLKNLAKIKQPDSNAIRIS